MEINVQFQKFVEFAQAAHEAGKDKKIARVGEGTTLEGRTISAASGDKVAPLWRSNANKVANNTARDVFKQAVIDIFGGENNIPKNVLDAMLMKDFEVGKPLTARRILAVKREIDKSALQYDQALTKVKTACADLYQKYAVTDPNLLQEGYQITHEQIDKRLDTIVKLALKDKDVLDLVTNEKVLDSLLKGGDGKFRSLESIQNKVKNILQNHEELLQATKGNKAFEKAGLNFLAGLEGKSVPRGVISSLVRAVNSANIGPLKRLSASSSGLDIHDALEHFVRLQTELSVASGAEDALDGADEKMTVRDFISEMLVAKCGRSSVAKIQAALNGDEAKKLQFVYDAISQKSFSPDGFSKGLLEHVETMGTRSYRMLNQFKMSIDLFMGTEFEDVKPFEEQFDTGEFGSGDILADMKAHAKKQAKLAYESAMPNVVTGNGPAADAIREIVTTKITLEPGEDPLRDFHYTSNGNIRSMVNWNICRDTKACVNGQIKNTPFAKDLDRGMVVKLPGNKQLSNDLDKALDELAEFVTKGEKKTFAELDATGKNKVYILTAMFSQESGKAAFDGQLTAMDPNNSSQPIVTASMQEDDVREFSIRFDDSNRLVMEFTGTQNLNAVITRNSDGKSSTHATNEGSTLKAQLSFRLHLEEFDRLAGLDFTKFEDGAAMEIMSSTQKDGQDKLLQIPETFAEEFKISPDVVDIDSAIKAEIA